MSKIKLDSRLSAVASLVRKGSVTADIGTDHAYLLCYLIQNGICPSGIGADLREGPLENARKTLIECELTDKVQLMLSDGLRNIPENSCSDIVIAGMGGILISEILERAAWVFNDKINIVAQPMTHAEFLREFLVKNGFEITDERTAADGKHYYCAICAHYTGKTAERNRSYYYLGELLRNKDEITKKYIEKMLFSLEKKFLAQKKAGIKDGEKLEELISEIKTKLTEDNYD